MFMLTLERVNPQHTCLIVKFVHRPIPRLKSLNPRRPHHRSHNLRRDNDDVIHYSILSFTTFAYSYHSLVDQLCNCLCLVELLLVTLLLAAILHMPINGGSRSFWPV